MFVDSISEFCLLRFILLFKKDLIRCFRYLSKFIYFLINGKLPRLLLIFYIISLYRFKKFIFY